MQQKFSDLLKQNRNILLICLLGLLARMAYVVLFSSFFARAYLGRETLFYAGSDFGTSLLAFNNLWQHGTYSVNLADTLGAFNRMPGYSFFIGIISLIFP